MCGIVCKKRLEIAWLSSWEGGIQVINRDRKRVYRKQ
jgi:hypothetical protein